MDGDIAFMAIDSKGIVFMSDMLDCYSKMKVFMVGVQCIQDGNENKDENLGNCDWLLKMKKP